MRCFSTNYSFKLTDDNDITDAQRRNNSQPFFHPTSEGVDEEEIVRSREDKTCRPAFAKSKGRSRLVTGIQFQLRPYDIQYV